MTGFGVGHSDPEEPMMIGRAGVRQSGSLRKAHGPRKSEEKMVEYE